MNRKTREEASFHHVTIEVPPGVTMRREKDGEERRHESKLRFRAFCGISPQGELLESYWRFYWVGKIFTVPRSQVQIVT